MHIPRQLVPGKAAAPRSAAERAPLQRVPAPNRTGLPDHLKAGVESLSGLSFDHVRVHRNSSKPAQLNAHAYAQGSEIHLAPGQEKHLPHEAWHLVQQAQGRVKPTMQLKGNVSVNDDAGLEREADVLGRRATGPVRAQPPLAVAAAPPIPTLAQAVADGSSPGGPQVTRRTVRLPTGSPVQRKLPENIEVRTAIARHTAAGPDLSGYHVVDWSNPLFYKIEGPAGEKITAYRNSREWRLAQASEAEAGASRDAWQREQASGLQTKGPAGAAAPGNRPPPAASTIASGVVAVASVQPSPRLPAHRVSRPPHDSSSSSPSPLSQATGSRVSVRAEAPLESPVSRQAMDAYENGLLLVTAVQRKDLDKMHSAAAVRTIAERAATGRIAMSPEDANQGGPLAHAKVNWTLTSPRMKPHYFKMIVDDKDRSPKPEPAIPNEIQAPRIATLADARLMGRRYLRGKTGDDDFGDWMQDQSSGKTARVNPDEPLFDLTDEPVARRFAAIKEHQEQPGGVSTNPEINTFGFPPQAAVGFLVTSGGALDQAALQAAKQAMGPEAAERPIPVFTWRAALDVNNPWTLVLLFYV